MIDVIMNTPGMLSAPAKSGARPLGPPGFLPLGPPGFRALGPPGFRALGPPGFRALGPPLDGFQQLIAGPGMLSGRGVEAKNISAEQLLFGEQRTL